MAEYKWIDKKSEAVIFHDGQKQRSFSSICPHMGAQLIWNEKKRSLVCPWHGLSFNIDKKCSNHAKFKTVMEINLSEKF